MQAEIEPIDDNDSRRTAELGERERAFALPETWPSVLRSPPWERSEKVESLADAVRPLAPLAYEEKMVWVEGEREAWLAMDPGDGDLAKIFSRSMLRLETIEAAVAGDEKARQWVGRWSMPVSILTLLEKPQALICFQQMPSKFWYLAPQMAFEPFLAQVELIAVVDKLIELFTFQSAYLTLAMPADSPKLAPRVAHVYHRQRKCRDEAAAWLRRHPRAAAIGLVPPALGKKVDLREDAQEGLLYLAAVGCRDQVLAVAAEYGVLPEIEALLQRDPLELFPAKLPVAPDFWDASRLTPPRLASGEALPPEAMARLGVMMAFSRPEKPYAGIGQVRQACDAASLARFAWDLFGLWLAAGAPAKEQWAMAGLGFFGDDNCARKLVPLIRLWPGEAAHARAVAGLEVLAMIGNDVSLMLLQSIAEKAKFKGLQASAREKIEHIAEARGLSSVELGDRLVPDFGLGEDGSLELDFGPRRFRVAFDAQLQPFVVDEEGKRLKDLPKATKADDAASAAEATEIYKALKKDAKAAAGLQIFRLEQAMVQERRFSREVFLLFFAHHPLIRHLASRLVWVSHNSAEVHYFRVAEDGSLTDFADRAFVLPAGAEVSVPHVISLPAEVTQAFRQLFADYEILQPFAQLDREVYSLSEGEGAEVELRLFEGREIVTGKLLGLEKRGWQRGAPQDGGISSWLEKPLEGKTLYLTFQGGIFVGDINSIPSQKLETLLLKNSGFEELEFAALSAIEASEMLRELAQLFS